MDDKEVMYLENELKTSIYKVNDQFKDMSTEERRSELLAIQRMRREFGNGCDDRNSKTSHTQNRRRKHFYQYMISEWFLKAPEDLNEQWVVKLIPNGIRLLLIAKKGHTSAFYKCGQPCIYLKTKFPGGDSRKGAMTVLDCVYNKDTQTFYIVDCLSWNNIVLLNEDAAFRFYWLRNRLLDSPELLEMSGYSFRHVDYLDVNLEAIQEELDRPSEINNGQVISYGGAVFYHKESLYTFGYTPLSLWLPTFMFQEMLGIHVKPEHLQNMPENYQNVEVYIKGIIDKVKRRTKISESVEMECEENNGMEDVQEEVSPPYVKYNRKRNIESLDLPEDSVVHLESKKRKIITEIHFNSLKRMQEQTDIFDELIPKKKKLEFFYE